jgi:signal transduction histidine kinase
MELKRRNLIVYALVLLVWLLVMGWQVQEHVRVKDYARNSLRNRSRDIANTLGAFIRGLQFRGAVFGDRLQPVLDDLVYGRTNDVLAAAEVVSVALLNAKGEAVASAGRAVDYSQQEVQEGERWGANSLTVVYPIEGAVVSQEGNTNPVAPVLLPALTNTMREPGRRFMPPPRPAPDGTNAFTPPPPGSGPDGPREGPRDEFRPRRPFWARGMDENEYQAMIRKRELHGLVLALSTSAGQAVVLHDLWLRFIIGFFATISAIGLGLAWRNLVTSSDLQIRLIRASQLNTHLREMNLAAAGLAHETRNPLNIIRGLAQMISKEQETTPETQQRSQDIIEEADKLAAQLNEFINYSRPREVRRVPIALNGVVSEVVRALNYDLDEKKIKLQTRGEPVTVAADEQLVRQALFNLLLNATQAVGMNGSIEVVIEKKNGEASIEIRDDGPGVPANLRQEIFKPYFTTQKAGTGLGLAVVHQIVLAHGWEIDCVANEPKGAVFRIRHLKLSA